MSQTIIDTLTPLTLIRKMNLLMKSSTRKSQKCELFLKNRKRRNYTPEKRRKLEYKLKRRTFCPFPPPDGNRISSCQNANFREKKINILTNILFFYFSFFLWHGHVPCARYWHCCPMGKGAVAIKMCLYISIYIRICIYIYTCIYNKLFFVSKTMERLPQSGDGSWSVGEEWYTRTMLLLLLSKPRPVLQSLCFTPSLLLLLPFPLIFYSPILSSFLSSFTVNASCALCRLSHVTFGLCAVQTACGQWVWGGRGYEEAVMMSKALPFLFPLCIRLNYAEQGIPCNC